MHRERDPRRTRGAGPSNPMRVKLMTFRYSATLGGFDTQPLDDFTRDKEVVAFREHFYTVNEVPHVTCVLTFQEALVPQRLLQSVADARQVEGTSGHHPVRAAALGYARDEGPRAQLSETDRLLYDALRTWRNTAADRQGVPPFALFSNRQMAEIVLRKPDSPTALGNLPGMGPSKVRKHGMAILSILQGQGSPAAAAVRVEPSNAAPNTAPATTVPAEAQGAPGDPAPESGAAG